MASPGEELFERYLRDHGYEGAGAQHPELGAGPKRPDYRISRGGHEAVCEHKQFETMFKWAKLRASLTGSAAWTADESLGPVRNAIKTAAGQLKALRTQGRPLIVVLSNPLGADVDLDPESVLHAMYGDPVHPISLGADGPIAGPATVGRNGQLTNSHQYISAVACLRFSTRADDWWMTQDANAQFRRRVRLAARKPYEEPAEAPKGDYVAVDLIDTRSALLGGAVRVPGNFFDGPDDQRWSGVNGIYERVR